MVRRAALISLAVIAMNHSRSMANPKANQCAACHGSNGLSSNDLWPNLAGQKKSYLIKQLKAFKAGERKDPLMDAMSKILSESDMEELAAYFAAMKNQ